MEVTEEGVVRLTDEEFSTVDTMLHFIARKYDTWSGVEYDDLKSELWAKTLVILKKEKRIETRWIAKCCYNLSLDICRSAKKYVTRYDVDSDLVDMVTESPEMSVPRQDAEEDETVIGRMAVEELVKRFPRNSRERNYLIYLTLYMGIPISDHKERNLTFEKVYGDMPKGCRRDLAVARALGFSDDTSSGYRKAKYAVREALADEYGIDMSRKKSEVNARRRERWVAIHGKDPRGRKRKDEKTGERTDEPSLTGKVSSEPTESSSSPMNTSDANDSRLPMDIDKPKESVETVTGQESITNVITESPQPDLPPWM